MFPFYLKFKGGKGFASYIGAALGLNFWLGLAISVAVIVIMVVTDYIVNSTVMTVLVVPVVAGLLAGSVWPTVILLVPTAIILYKHRINFARIKDGTEFKVSSAFKGKHRVDK
jgi:glycerol-3-phosphate acyltransferase PlsY